MKLRIRDNSVRLRLTRSEVDVLHRDGFMRSKIEFPGDREFHYVVESSPAVVNAGAFLADNNLTVRLPESAVEDWATTEQVSIEGEQILDDGKSLCILVEKDFVCLTERDEDESDMFPHPEAETLKGKC